MELKIDEIFATENDLRKVNTEDDIAYLPTYSIAVKVGDDTYEHPSIFETEFRAENFMDIVEERGIINTNIWLKYEPKESYSNGDYEYHDDEEGHYLNN